MPKLSDRVPRYPFHKHSGQAIVTLGGEDHYLGPYGTQVSKNEYDRVVAEWLARGRRRTPPPEHASASINDVILQFWEYAKNYYRRSDGTATSEVENFRQALRPLRKLYGTS